MNSHVGVATHDNSRYVASTNAYIVNGPHHIYHNPGYVQGQKAAQPRAAVEQPRGPLPHRVQLGPACQLKGPNMARGGVNSLFKNLQIN